MSAAGPLVDALVAALEADATLAARLGATPSDGKVYVGLAPNAGALPYLTIGASTESDGGAGHVFGARGFRGAETIHCWVAGQDKRAALALYGEVYRVLDGTVLALTGHTLLTGRVTLVRTLSDDTRTAMQAVAEYRTDTRRAA